MTALIIILIIIWHQALIAVHPMLTTILIISPRSSDLLMILEITLVCMRIIVLVSLRQISVIYTRAYRFPLYSLPLIRTTKLAAGLLFTSVKVLRKFRCTI